MMLGAEMGGKRIAIERGSVGDTSTRFAGCMGCGGTSVVQVRATANLVCVPGRGGGVEVDFWSGHREWDRSIGFWEVSYLGWAGIRIPGREERRGTGICVGWVVIRF
jgi:hypothetical protein